MSRALVSWCRSLALLAATLALALLVVRAPPRPAGELSEEEELSAALAQWIEQDDSRSLEERRAAVHAYRKLVQETADAVVGERLTLDEAAQRLHDFLTSRCPEQLRYNKQLYNLDSAATETRISLLWHIKVGVSRGEYADVPAAVADCFAEIPPQVLALPELAPLPCEP